MTSAMGLPRTADPQSDDALMASAGTGDRAAFRSLVERHGERPYRVAWRMLGEAGEAEDVAQEALLKLWAQAPRWRSGEAGVGAWLSRVATNACLDRLRRRRFVSGDEIPERADDAPLADARIASEQIAQRTQCAIAALPGNQRAAIVLTYYEDFTNQMASEAMEMKLKAFESLLFRARAALRMSLGALREELA